MNIKSHNFISLLLSFLIFMLSISSNSMNTYASSNSCTYRVYDATTAQYNRSYTITYSYENNGTATYASNNNRVVDWTKSGVVKIMGQNNYRGTGIVVDSHTIATVAHTLCVSGTYNVIPITSIYLFDTSGNKTFEATPVEYHIPQYHCSYGNVETDYALITVEEDLSAYKCFNLGIALDGMVGEAVSITGFPQTINGATVNNATEHQKYTGIGNITRIDEDVIIYSNTNTSNGDSGAPIYVTHSHYGEVYYTVIGLHSKSTLYATPITSKKLHFYYDNPNIQW